MKIAVHTNVVKLVDKLCLYTHSLYDRFPLPETLYHYCSTNAAIGIRRSNEFWLSDSFNTNDEQEIKSGLRLFRRLLKNSPAFGKDEQKLRLLEHIYYAMQLDHAPRVFFTSFSCSRNDINSFRLYADKTRGVMLGVSSKSLRRPHTAYDTTGRATRQSVILPVFYNDEDKESLLTMQIDAFGLALTTLENADQLSHGNRWYITMNFLGLIYQFIAAFKDADWRAEQEVRLAVTLMTKSVEGEVGPAGLRRPFSRPHPRTGNSIEYLKCFAPRNIDEIPPALTLADECAQWNHEQVGVTELILGASNEDGTVDSEFRDIDPAIQISRNNARYKV